MEKKNRELGEGIIKQLGYKVIPMLLFWRLGRAPMVDSCVIASLSSIIPSKQVLYQHPPTTPLYLQILCPSVQTCYKRMVIIVKFQFRGHFSAHLMPYAESGMIHGWETSLRSPCSFGTGGSCYAT